MLPSRRLRSACCCLTQTKRNSYFRCCRAGGTCTARARPSTTPDRQIFNILRSQGHPGPDEGPGRQRADPVLRRSIRFCPPLEPSTRRRIDSNIIQDLGNITGIHPNGYPDPSARPTNWDSDRRVGITNCTDFDSSCCFDLTDLRSWMTTCCEEISTEFISVILELRDGAKDALEFKDRQYVEDHRRASKALAALINYHEPH